MKNKKKRSNRNHNNYNIFLVIPLALIAAVVPLIVFLKVVPPNGATLMFTNYAENFDFFSYYKMYWLLIFTGFGVLLFLYRKFFLENIELRRSKIYYPMIAYGVLVILSTLFATYRQVSLQGFVDRYENMYVLLAYMVLVFLGYNFIDNEKQVKVVLSSLGASALAMFALGFSQFLGKDFLMTDLGKKLILPAQYEHIAESLRFTFASSQSIYGTLYNINYVGVYMSMIFVLGTTLFLLLKDYRYKIFFGIVSVASFLALLGSRSRAGMFSMVVFGILMIIFFRRLVIRRWKSFAIIAIAVGVVFVGVNQTGDGLLVNRLKAGYESLKTSQEADLKDIVLEDDTAEIIFKDYSMKITFSENSFALMDGDGNLIEASVEENVIMPAIEPFNSHSFAIKVHEENPVLETTISTNRGRRNIKFVEDDGEIKVIGYGGEYITDISAPYVGFEGRERLASSRGYIWSRTIPMLKETIFIGHGADTYALHFPNNDYVGKFLGFTSTNTIVDKPHSMYLQSAVNTGILSVLALLVLFGMYIVSSFQAYFFKRDYDDFIDTAGLAIFMAVVIYLFTGISNDSTVSVAPVFWTLLGIGFILNKKTIERDRKNEAD
ncbi:O-antigen ligase family protein [Gudongella sp. DL1XJH-153]|uniref:O-antigen ligase family protein n=1 Tax=Gudongella sp. DL1XJH-153 TaxID=3409804 RepID=UPI003BB57B29